MQLENIKMSRKCMNSPDNFCYVCGDMTFVFKKVCVYCKYKKVYFLYFGCKVGDWDKKSAPHI